MRRVLFLLTVIAVLAIHCAYDASLLQTALAQEAAASATAIPIPSSKAPQESPATAEADEQQIVRAVIEDFLTNPRLEKLRTFLGQPDQKELMLIRQSPVTWPFEVLAGVAGRKITLHSLAPRTVAPGHYGKFHNPREVYPETEPYALGLRLGKLELDADGGWFVELTALKLGWDERDDAAVATAKAKWERIVAQSVAFDRSTASKNFDRPKQEEIFAMSQEMQYQLHVAGSPNLFRELKVFYEGQRPVSAERVKLLAFDYPGDARTGAEQVALWRRVYRFRSLRPLLAYERGSAASVESQAKQSTEQVEANQQRRPGDHRAASLHMLHYLSAEKFMEAPGFGMSRMPPPGAMYLNQNEWLSVQELEKGPDLAGYGLGPTIMVSKLGNHDSRSPSKTNLQDYHAQGQEVFFDGRLTGYFESVDRVAGFDGHRLWRKPELGNGPRMGRHRFDYPIDKMDRWRTTQFQLVSMLKFPQPAVYVSEHMPNMKELVKAPTRPLDGFEEESLKALQGGETFVIEARTNRIRMLGALRARKDCTDCHSVKEGALLGAFAYTLLRDPPVPTTEEPTAPLLQADKAAPLAEISK